MLFFSERTETWRCALALGAVLVVFVGLALRQHLFVDRYAVNMMFWDQWDFYRPMFQHEGWWACFTQQQGPHRQGIGFVLTRILAEWSGWNSRWDAFSVSFTLIGAAALGLRLTWQCGARVGLGLAVVPLLFFNLRQYEIFVGASNVSHGAMPMLLFMAYCLTWFVHDSRRRFTLLSGFTFLLIFTGFGIFVGLLTPLLLLIEGVQALRARDWRRTWWIGGALVGVGVVWALFAHGYHFDSAVPGFRFPYEKPREYAYFVALMLANFYGVPGSGPGTLAFGFGISAVLAALCGWHGWRLIRRGVAEEPRSTVIFCLAAYTLIYCAFTAVGRVFLGFGWATSPRYVTLMAPAALTIFLQLATLPYPKLAGGLALTYALLLVVGTGFLREGDWEEVRRYCEGRKTWKVTYLTTHDEKLAEKKADFPIYPGSIAARLRYLERNRLNLFNPDNFSL